MTTSNGGTYGCGDVCSLPNDELSDRVARIRSEILPHVTGRQPLADGVAFDFEHTAAMQKTLEDFVAFERECCSGLTWDLHRPSDRVLRLSVQGLDPGSDFFRALGNVVDAPVRGRLARLAQAMGFGGGNLGKT